MGDDRARDCGDEQAVFLEVSEALGLGAWENSIWIGVLAFERGGQWHIA